MVIAMEKGQWKVILSNWLYAHKLFIVLLIALLTLTAWLWPVHAFDRSAQEVESIHLFDGTSGRSADITDPAEIGTFVEALRQVPLRRSFDLSCFAPRDGFNLSVNIKLKGTGQVQRFTLSSDRSIENVFFYHSYGPRFPFDQWKALCQ